MKARRYRLWREIKRMNLDFISEFSKCHYFLLYVAFENGLSLIRQTDHILKMISLSNN